MRNLLIGLSLVAFFVASCSNETASTPDTAATTNNTTPSTTSSSTVENETVISSDTQTTTEIIATNEESMTSTTSLTETSTTSKPTPTSSTTTTTTTKNSNDERSETTEVANTTTSTNSTTTSSTTSSSTTTTSNTPPRPPPSPTKTTANSKPMKPALSHNLFDELLRKHVSSSGAVDYNGFKKEEKILAQYLDILKVNPPQNSWSQNKQMAFWINLYNAFTIKTILENYPVASIMDIDGGKVWDKRKIMIGNKSYTLNQIEKNCLIKRFKEPRVHFAVNCGAISCPALLNKAWSENNVQRYYDTQAKAFINNSTHNSVNGNKIEISQIFNWYAGDFGGADKTVPYFQKYSSTTIKKNAKVKFREYNWKLNKK